MTRVYYAHTHETRDWEPLEEHLRLVAQGDDQGFPGAAGFARAFGAEEWGRLAGWWHDLGKYSEAFQRYLAASQGDSHQGEVQGRVNHSSAGAIHAAKTVKPGGKILSYCIAGHHAGLPDHVGGRAGLKDRLAALIEPFDHAPAEITVQTAPSPPPLKFDTKRADAYAFQFSLFVRMLFSCLVDADFLATEQYMRPDQAVLRSPPSPSMSDFAKSLDRHLAELATTSKPSTVNEKRAEVLEQSRQAAVLAPGFFSLQVPTGGGKTLSSLAFALRHAAQHNLRRVIYAIPFTSIIEQTAQVFRKALGNLSEYILEHHSNLDPESFDKQSGEQNHSSTISRLAAENWDAPLIVTTNVQLFESLFASRTSRCRKLHRIARSVIILDEAQTLPVKLLKPTLMLLQELVTNYGCTVVLCTATQPAIERNEEFPIGLTDVRPIISEPEELFDDLKRVDIEHLGKLDDEALVGRLDGHPQVLCIVNTKRHAAKLFHELKSRAAYGEQVFHLSAYMCPTHRSDKLTEIKEVIKSGQPCRIISTQLIEAGVDIDLPVVYRAMAGLDSIAQAAGRCNREGKLERGQVYVFETDAKPPPFIAQAAQAARKIIPDYTDLLSPAAVTHYFGEHYWTQGGEAGENWDAEKVGECFCLPEHFQFREAAQRYRLIDDIQIPIIIPYDDRSRRLRDELMAMEEPPPRGFDRRLQRYVVSVMPHDLQKLQDGGVLLENHERWVLGNKEAYDREQGLRFDIYGLDADSTIV